MSTPSLEMERDGEVEQQGQVVEASPSTEPSAALSASRNALQLSCKLKQNKRSVSTRAFLRLVRVLVGRVRDLKKYQGSRAQLPLERGCGAPRGLPVICAMCAVFLVRDAKQARHFSVLLGRRLNFSSC